MPRRTKKKTEQPEQPQQPEQQPEQPEQEQQEEEKQPLIKCTSCKCNKVVEQFLKDGQKLKTCIVCRNNQARRRARHRCIHNRVKRKCIDCNGTDTCRHRRQKFICKECKGNGICQHNREHYKCRKCKINKQTAGKTL